LPEIPATRKALVFKLLSTLGNRERTPETQQHPIKSQLLYRLSYRLLRGANIAMAAKPVNVRHHDFHYYTKHVAAGAPRRLCDHSEAY
jgi:hypothetical protein